MSTPVLVCTCARWTSRRPPVSASSPPPAIRSGSSTSPRSSHERLGDAALTPGASYEALIQVLYEA